MTPNGSMKEFLIMSEGVAPFGIVSGPDGNLWFTEYNTGRIGRITPAGDITEFGPITSALPQRIAVGPDGALWFTEPGTNGIGRITTSGKITHFVLRLGNPQPAGISGGPGRQLWFTLNTADRLAHAELVAAEPTHTVTGTPSQSATPTRTATASPSATTSSTAPSSTATGTPTVMNATPTASLSASSTATRTQTIGATATLPARRLLRPPASRRLLRGRVACRRLRP